MTGPNAFERVRAVVRTAIGVVWMNSGSEKSLDPFQLAKTIESKLERIYRLANRRLSPKR